MNTHALTIEAANLAAAEALCKDLRESGGFLAVRILPDGSVAGLLELLFTRAVALGCGESSFANRFCFEDRELAVKRFCELQSEDDVPEGHTASRVGLGERRRPGLRAQTA